MRATDGSRADNVAATSAELRLMGGKYRLTAIGTFGGAGAVGVQFLGPNASTFIAAHTALSATGTFVDFVIPPSVVKVVVADTTALYWTLTRIPQD